MRIIGCDYHPSFQQIAMLETETGELTELKLGRDQVEDFFAALPAASVVGMEATGNAQWFEGLLQRLGHELWLGDASKIRAMEVRQQKTDRRDARLLLELMVDQRFPRIWSPSAAVRDARQLVLHRHKLVEMRTRVKNELQHLAMNQGVQKKRKLWSKAGREILQQLPLSPWAARRRQDLLAMLDDLEHNIAALDEAVLDEARSRPEVVRLMTHPGVGPVIGLAFVLTLGPVERFARGKQVASYLGLIPREHSSGGRQRLGSITKQGNCLMRCLLVEGAQTAARLDPGLKRDYQRLRQRKGSTALAKVMVARKLAIRLYWMLRENKDYAQSVGMQDSPRGTLVDSSPSRA